MKAYPHFNKRVSHDLNVVWDFKFLEDVAFEEAVLGSMRYDDRLVVPSAFDAFPNYAGKRGLGVYRCFVDTTPQTASVLKIGGAGPSCKVYVDGRLLGEHIGTYTPFEVEVPATPRTRREIVIVTDNRFDAVRCPLHKPYFDFYHYGGIIRQVWLEELPPNAIRQLHVRTEDWTTGKVRMVVEFVKDIAPFNISIDGGLCDFAEIERINERTVACAARVADPLPWSMECPNLHLVTIDSGQDSITTRFGLRKVEAKDGQILINGTPVKLLGYCRHEAHPEFGPATPSALMVTDLQLLKDMGCNFIRGSHYQQDPLFLDLCDELGFVVFSESTAWNPGPEHLTDRAFIDAQMKQTAVMVTSDFNHPSIIIWGFLNEGASDLESSRNCYSQLIALVRHLDPSRLVTYASSRHLSDLFLNEVDVISFNIYPGWYSPNRDNECPLDEVIPGIREMVAGLEELQLSSKPFLISEIGAGAIYGFRDNHGGFWTEQFQAELLRLVCEEAVANSKIAGLLIWQFCDIRTMQGSGALLRPRGFNNKGTFDEYRRPKAAYETVKDVFLGFKSNE